MATTAPATSQPMTEPTSSVATTTAARTSSETPIPPLPRRSESENSGSRRPSAASSGSKHSKRHGNQPILVWLQRKIGGGNKGSIKKRQASVGLVNTTNTHDGPKTRPKESNADSTVRGSRHHSHHSKSSEPARSLHSRSAKSDSLRPESAWGMHTMELEADDDASIRPLPPSAPPSPVPSRMTNDSEQTSIGYSELRSSRGAPSTKPTTLMSLELGAGGHIAQVPSISSSIQPYRGAQFAGPPTPTAGSPVTTRFPNVRPAATTSASVSFSPHLAAPSRSNTATSLAPSTVGPAVSNLIADTTQTPSTNLVVPAPNNANPKLIIQIPGVSQPHPRNNPRPASPPPDNASTLTLASSTFAMSRASPRSRSVAADREQFDTAASMRALRPSSRRGSWGSDETGWSAAALSTQTGLSSAGPMLLGFGAGQRRRGPGSIATARSAWSYRAGGKEGTLEGPSLMGAESGDEEVDEDEDEDGESFTEEDGQHHHGIQMITDQPTPTEDGAFDYALSSPISVLPHEVPLPASPDLTPTELPSL